MSAKTSDTPEPAAPRTEPDQSEPTPRELGLVLLVTHGREALLLAPSPDNQNLGYHLPTFELQPGETMAAAARRLAAELELGPVSEPCFRNLVCCEEVGASARALVVLQVKVHNPLPPSERFELFALAALPERVDLAARRVLWALDNQAVAWDFDGRDLSPVTEQQETVAPQPWERLRSAVAHAALGVGVALWTVGVLEGLRRGHIIGRSQVEALALAMIPGGLILSIVFAQHHGPKLKWGGRAGVVALGIFLGGWLVTGLVYVAKWLAIDYTRITFWLWALGATSAALAVWRLLKNSPHPERVAPKVRLALWAAAIAMSFMVVFAPLRDMLKEDSSSKRNTGKSVRALPQQDPLDFDR